MGFLKRLVGGKKKQTPSTATVPSRTTPGGRAPAPTPDRQVPGSIDPAKDPNMIKVFDAYGRELFITRDAWRDSVLKGTIDKAWNDADQLASLTVQCLHDQFLEESLRPAKRLLELDRDAERSSVLLSIAYLKNKRLDESERTLTEFIERHGERAVILTNLAKVYADRGEHERAYETLWRGLQIDPNQDNGLLWYEALHREKGGVEAGQEALRRLAKVRGSWRAQLWLARHALQQKNLPEAMRLYQEGLSNVRGDIPADLLMHMSGDLGNNGHIAEHRRGRGGSRRKYGNNARGVAHVWMFSRKEK
ncbi:MAG TPA: tetratricopeptide repeat protein [Tepidisphaeraceae bacterium]|nr:tetratricopeptide repeat protein [Tepidisphaeraceae bacterium]